MKALEREQDTQTAEDRKKVEELRNMINMDDDASGVKDANNNNNSLGGKVLEKTLEKIKALVNQKTEEQEAMD